MKKRFSSGQFHQSATHLPHPPEHILGGHFLPPVKGVSRVTPVASKVAPSQANKNTWKTGVGRLSLDRLKNLGYDHGLKLKLTGNSNRFPAPENRESISVLPEEASIWNRKMRKSGFHAGDRPSGFTFSRLRAEEKTIQLQAVVEK